MSTVKITLKKGYPEPETIETDSGKPKTLKPKKMSFTKAGKSISLTAGQVIEVPLRDLQMWLNTGKIEQVTAETAPASDNAAQGGAN